MRLLHTDPQALVGRTIIYRHQFWQVTSIDEENIRLGKGVSKDKGLLRKDQLAQCRLYPTDEEIAAKYPRLLRALRWACLLTHSEAESALRGYLTTGTFFMGSEAVAHVGGALYAIRHAIGRRRAVLGQARLATPFL